MLLKTDPTFDPMRQVRWRRKPLAELTREEALEALCEALEYINRQGMRGTLEARVFMFNQFPRK